MQAIQGKKIAQSVLDDPLEQEVLRQSAILPIREASEQEDLSDFIEPKHLAQQEDSAVQCASLSVERQVRLPTASSSSPAYQPSSLSRVPSAGVELQQSAVRSRASAVKIGSSDGRCRNDGIQGRSRGRPHRSRNSEVSLREAQGHVRYALQKDAGYALQKEAGIFDGAVFQMASGNVRRLWKFAACHPHHCLLITGRFPPQAQPLL